MDDVVYNQTLKHEVLRGGVVAAGRSAQVSRLGPPVVVAWHNLVEDGILAVHTYTQITTSFGAQKDPSGKT